MSRHLPARPNLEHLKKQARELLSQLRQQREGARLADAQRALALEYGFPSWPRLKAYVDSLATANSLPAASTTLLHAFIGTWSADLSRSVRHPLNQYRSVMLRFDVNADIVTIDDVVVDAAGREEQTRNVIHADGEPRHANYGYVTTARWLSARVLEAVVTQHGRLEGRVTYEVSEDQATLTVTADEQTGVFIRSAH